MSKYHDKRTRRYLDKQEGMTELQLAHAGIKDLKLSFALCSIFLVVLAGLLMFTRNEIAFLLLLATVCSIPFMVFEWFSLKGTIRKDRNGRDTV